MTAPDRAKKTAELVSESNDQFIIWCDTNFEADELKKAIPEAVEIRGSDSIKKKESVPIDFVDGKIRVLISKPSIFGFGLNFQHCHNTIFCGLSYSYESFYQAVRRCWRFGQKNKVNCHIITAETEGAVVRNVRRKEKDAEKMAIEMVKNMHVYNEENIKGERMDNSKHKTKRDTGKNWEMNLGDCVDVVSNIESDSVGYSIFSPPFASLYTYSNSPRDMGNCKDDDEFMQHFAHLVPELFRVIQPGRLLSFHCMNLPTSKVRDGYIGIKDFRGDLIRMFQDAGFIFHSEVCIWKDPVTAMQRTKALGLLHKQIVKDSCMSRQGIPDYLATMRKPGENKNPVAGELDYFAGDKSTFQNTGKLSIDIWQKYASPIWDDINPSRTLQKQSARDEKDERHICPLQLDVIERGMQLWSAEGDLVLSPFSGIASEGYVALQCNRRFVGAELKESYYNQAVKNLIAAEQSGKDLFE